MWKQLTQTVLLAMILALVLGGPAHAGFNPLKDPAIIGWQQSCGVELGPTPDHADQPSVCSSTNKAEQYRRLKPSTDHNAVTGPE